MDLMGFGIGHFEAWIIAAIVLIVAETVVSGAFLIFLGFGALAAAIAAAVSFGLPAQIAVFAVVSIITSLLLRRIFKRVVEKPALTSTGHELNRPELELVGRIVVVCQEISSGRGRVKVGDTTWACKGADTPVGEKVRVTGVSGVSLDVEPTTVS